MVVGRFSASHRARPPFISLHVLVSVVPQLPEGPGGEPVVVVAIQDDRRVGANAAAAQQRFHLATRNDVSRHVLLQLALPVPGDGAGDVALFVGGCVNVDLHQTHVGVAAVFSHPIGGHQRLGVCVFSHGYTSPYGNCG